MGNIQGIFFNTQFSNFQQQLLSELLEDYTQLTQGLNGGKLIGYDVDLKLCSSQNSDGTKRTSAAGKEEIPSKINPGDYTVDELKKIYPEDKYEIDDNKRQRMITVRDKSTGKKVLTVYSEKGWTYIDEFDENEKSKLFRAYDEAGNLFRYSLYEGEYIYPIVEDIYADVCAKNSYGMPTTGKDILKHIKQITPRNVVEILNAYEKKGETLEEAINSEWGLDKKVKEEILAHIKKCLEEHYSYDKYYNYDKNYKNENSQVKNEFYKGASYSVVQKGEVLEITNKNTGKKSKIDFNVLLKGADIRQSVILKAIIQKLPGEVLEDIAAECTSINPQVSSVSNWLSKLKQDDEPAGTYSPRDDKISLNYYNTSVIVHELGHAIDNPNSRSTYSTDSEEFKKVFEEEMKAYEAAGNKRFPDGAYCTYDEQEMFAESYEMLMLGKPNGVIIKYFPKTLEMCKKILQEVRNLPADERH